LQQPFPKEYRIGLIFDDLTSKRHFRKLDILEELFSNGRHYHAILLISCQYVKQLPPPLRGNCDYIIILHNAKLSCRILYEEFIGLPDSFAAFMRLMRAVTGQKDQNGRPLYNGLVFDNTAVSYKLEHMFFIYRTEGVDALSHVKLGTESWRTFTKTHFKDAEQEEEVKEYRKKKRIERLKHFQNRRRGIDHRVGQDLDYFSDEDDVSSEGGISDTVHDSIEIDQGGNGKKQQKTKIMFERPRIHVGDSVSSKVQSTFDDMSQRSQIHMSDSCSFGPQPSRESRHFADVEARESQLRRERHFADAAMLRECPSAAPSQYYETHRTQPAPTFEDVRTHSQFHYNETFQTPELDDLQKRREFIRQNSVFVDYRNRPDETFHRNRDGRADHLGRIF